ncbi:outer membrane protein assembly factor BamB family protein [Wenjunlia tyrosinilytica]|nr:PQQ-binding-like beta-propeller repeat protein [Wenjunlia tyrosinilytica]
MRTTQAWSRLLMTAAGAAVAFSLAACGGGHAPSGAKAPHGDLSNSSMDGGGTRSQAPPQAFAPEAIASFSGRWPRPTLRGGIADFLTLGDRLAYTYDVEDVGITAYRLDTGEIAWHKAVQDGDSVAQAPRLAGTAVVGAFGTSTAGSGTSAGGHTVTVVAYDAATGRQLWAREVEKGKGTSAASPRVVGADDRRVLVSVSEEGYSQTPPMSALLDTRTGRVVWTDRDFDGIDLEKSVAVGTRDDGDFAGRSTADGRRMWKRQLVTGEALTADPGPGLTLANGIGAGESRLVDPVTGKARLDMGDATVRDCHYDGWTTTVCSGADGSGSAAITAVDLPTGRVLWRLPDRTANRIAPEVTTAWHGVVYAEADAPMTLDARTGKDLRTDVGAAPSVVNHRFGLGYEDTEGIVEVYRAKG